jgi:hypothetical protein
MRSGIRLCVTPFHIPVLPHTCGPPGQGMMMKLNACMDILILEKSVMGHLVSNTGGDLRFLRDLNTIFTPSPTSMLCYLDDQSYSSDWRTSIEKNIENIPKLEVGRPRYVAWFVYYMLSI